MAMSEPRIIARIRDADLLAGVKAAAATYRARLTHWTDSLMPASELADASLVVLEAANSNSALHDFRVARENCPKAEIVILATSLTTPEDVRRLFRAGARDVLAAPLAQEQLMSAMGEAIGPGQCGDAKGFVLGIVKSAGGIGATTLAVNLAGAFADPQPAKRGEHVSAMKVALLDFDVQFGDASLAMDIVARKTLADILRASKRLDAHFLDGVLERHRSGVRILSAPPTTTPLEAVDAEVATSIVNIAVSSHDLVIVELPMAWTDWVGALLRRSDHLLLVSSAAVRSVAGARRVLDAAAEMNVPATRWSIAFNRLNRALDSGDMLDQARRALGQPVIGSLGEDPVVRDAGDRGRLIGEAAPNSRFAKDMRPLNGEIMRMLEQKRQPHAQSGLQR